MEKFLISSIILAIFLTIIVATLHDLPAYIEKCHRYDPKINECLLKATETVRPYLQRGIPELSVPPLEPYDIPEIILQQGTPSLNFRSNLSEIVVRGLTNYKFTRFDFDVPKLEWNIEGTVEAVELDGNYLITGKVLIVPVEGHGSFHCNIGKLNVTVWQKTVVVERNGEEYLHAVKTKTRIDAGGMKVEIKGLFGGNEELGRFTNKLINDNIDDLFKEIRPVVERVITDLMEQNLLKSLEVNVPYDKLCPPIE